MSGYRAAPGESEQDRANRIGRNALRRLKRAVRTLPARAVAPAPSEEDLADWERSIRSLAKCTINETACLWSAREHDEARLSVALIDRARTDALESAAQACEAMGATDAAGAVRKLKDMP